MNDLLGDLVAEHDAPAAVLTEVADWEQPTPAAGGTVVVGPLAEEWLSIARAFAGPPPDGRPPLRPGR